MERNGMPQIEPGMATNAVSVYNESGMDDFPVLKAFQQYIDAEQAKARKRLLALSAAFGLIIAAITAIAAVVLVNITNRNQQLNDRLVEFAMKERAASAVVVQPQQDNATLLALTAKLDEMQKKLADERLKADRAAAEAARMAKAAAAPKGPTKEELEIQRLNALLQAEREKVAAEAAKRKEAEKAEKERKRQEELEAYRRKHYPEFYGLPKAEQPKPKAKTVRKQKQKIVIDEDEDDEEILDDNSAISYFDEDDEVDEKTVRKSRVAKPKASVKKTVKPVSASTEPDPAAEKKAVETEKPTPEETKSAPKEYKIPIEVRGTSSSWSLPND